MKVFWSWQSDSPGKTGRHLIRQSLVEAINELKQPDDVEEPRERETKDALHLDHDRQGVSGSPDLARTILDKIDASAVFVADVTPVSTIPGSDGVREKRNLNPNVAIELGYALRSLSDRNVLMVLNTHYGDRSFLPFDLAHKAGPIQFELHPEAGKDEIDKQRRLLKRQFVEALGSFLLGASRTAVTPPIHRVPMSLSRAVYFQLGETLAEFGEDEDRVEYGYQGADGFYLRVIPKTQRSQPFTRAELMAEMRRSGMWAMWRGPSGMFAANEHGTIVVEPNSPSGGSPKASTQLFTSGEVWGFAPWLLVENDYGKFVPGKAFEDTFRRSLSNYLDFISSNLKLGPPYVVEAGAVGLKGMRIGINNDWDSWYGPFYDNEFSIERVLNDVSQPSIDAFLLETFEGLYRLSGYPRPEGLFGFPTVASQ